MDRLTQAWPRLRHWFPFGIIALAAALALAVFVRANPQTVALDLEDATIWSRVYEVETTTEGEVFRWTRSRSSIILPLTAIGSHRLTLALQSGRAEPGAVPVTLDGPRLQQTIAVAQQPRRYHLLVNGPAAVGPTRLTLNTPTFPSPAPLDMRELGIALRGGASAPLSGALPWCWLTAAALAVQPFLLYLLLRKLPRGGPWLQTALAALWLPLQLPWLLAWGYNDYVCVFSLCVAIILAGLVQRNIFGGSAMDIKSNTSAPAPSQQARPLLRDTHARWAIFLILLVAYLGALFLSPQPAGMTITNGDEPHYLLRTHSLYADQDFDPLNNYEQEDWRRFYDGEELTPHLVPYRDRLVPLHPTLGVPLAILPAYALGGLPAVRIWLCLLLSLAMVALYQSMRGAVSRPIALSVILISGLCYPVIIYSSQIYPDTLAFCLVAGALALIMPPTTQHMRLKAVGIGLALGCLPHLHIKLVPLAVFLYLFFLWNYRSVWRTALGWSSVPATLMAGLWFFWLFLVYGELSPDIFTTSYPDEFVGSPLAGVLGLFFDQAHGLMFYAPIYMLVFWGVWAGWRTPHLRSTTLALVAVYMSHHLLVGTWWDWIGGLSAVPRSIIAVLPLLIVLGAYASDDLWRRKQWLQPLVLVLVTAAITLLVLNNKLLSYGFGLASNALLREYFRVSELAAWLPSFVQPAPLRAYGLLLFLLALFLVLWYIISVMNDLLLWAKKKQGILS
jgi:hypothetical protein